MRSKLRMVVLQRYSIALVWVCINAGCTRVAIKSDAGLTPRAQHKHSRTLKGWSQGHPAAVDNHPCVRNAHYTAAVTGTRLWKRMLPILVRSTAAGAHFQFQSLGGAETRGTVAGRRCAGQTRPSGGSTTASLGNFQPGTSRTAGVREEPILVPRSHSQCPVAGGRFTTRTIAEAGDFRMKVVPSELRPSRTVARMF